MTNDEILKVLDDLTQTAKDGAEGYRLAADSTEDADLSAIFTTFSSRRQAFVSELQGLSAGFGGDPSASSSVVATLHRGWINLKQAISSNDRAAILAECQRGDEHAVESYSDALDTPLPMSILEILRSQLALINETLQKITHLADLGREAS